MTEVRIRQFLSDLGLEEYLAQFVENEITYDLLHTLTNSDLRELGVTATRDMPERAAA